MIKNMKEIDNVKYRLCTMCKEWKSLDCFSFYSRKNRNGHYSSHCKPCHVIYAARFRRENPEKVNSTIKAWTQNNKERIRGSERKRRANLTEEQKHKLRVRKRLSYAVKTGKIKSASCFICSHDGCTERAHDWHHHNGYGEGHEFDVVPLCLSHHNMTRRKYNF